MTTRTLAHVTPDVLQRLAFNSGRDIEIDGANERAYLRIDGTTFVAELSMEPCS